MTPRWPVVQLSEACKKIQDGAHHSPKNLYSEPGPDRFLYLTSKNIRTGYLRLDPVQYCDSSFHTSIYPRCNPETGDVLLTKDGANTGNVTVNTLEEPFSLLSSVCLLKPDPGKLQSGFLAYYLQSTDGLEQMTGQMTGAAIKRIILKTIRSSEIPLPPLPEQRRIVAILDEAFAGIDSAVKIVEKNLANARELFESYLNSVFTQRGEGWDEKELGELLIRIDAGWSPRCNSDRPAVGEWGVLKVSAVSSGQYLPQESKRLRNGLVPRPAIEVKAGDVIVSRANGNPDLVGRPAFVETTPDKLMLSDKTLRLVPDSDRFLPRFMYWAMQARGVREAVLESTTGTDMRNISQAGLRRLVVAIPDLSEQERSVAGIDALNAKTRKLEDLSRGKMGRLRDLKQSILHKAFTGELTADSEHSLSEATA